MNQAIEVKNLTFAYGQNKIIDNVSFCIPEGRYVGIIGPNGGGKTTLLKLLTGLIDPNSGVIKILGQKISSQLSKIAYVSQRSVQQNLYFPATVREIVTSGVLYNSSNDVDSILQKLDISHLADRLMYQLSGGQRQRVFLARALVSAPKILLLDEPFVGIDLPSQIAFYKLLKNLNTEQKITIVFVSHDLDVISKEVDEVFCLNKRLVCTSDSKNLEENEIFAKSYGEGFKHIHSHS